MRCEDAQELITALVDNELSTDESRSIKEHVDDCHRCLFIFQQESSLKAQIRLAAASVAAPAQLRERILANTRKASSASDERGWNIFSGLGLPAVRPAFAMLFLVLLVLPAVYLMWPAGNISLAALETHQSILQGRFVLVRSDSAEKITEELVHSVAGRFAPMGYDLSMMRLRPVGGAVQKLRNRKMLATVYEGEAPTVTCFTLLGTLKDVPQEAKLFFDPAKKISFYTFSRGDINGVLHREGDIICILVSKMPMADLLGIARLKAQPA